MGPANSDRILRVPPYSGVLCRLSNLPVRDYHPLRCNFPDTSGSFDKQLVRSYDPVIAVTDDGLGCFLFARHYWGNRFFFLFLQVLRCFSSLSLPVYIIRDRSSTCRVAPFRYGRINSCLPIPGLFRSLPRLSSPIEAKASAVRPSFLRLESSQ